MRRIFLLVMSVFVSVCISAQRWTNGVTKGDKVEQKPSSDYWLYEDENTSFFYIVNDVTFILELPNDKVRLINSQNGQGTPVLRASELLPRLIKTKTGRTIGRT